MVQHPGQLQRLHSALGGRQQHGQEDLVQAQLVPPDECRPHLGDVCQGRAAERAAAAAAAEWPCRSCGVVWRHGHQELVLHYRHSQQRRAPMHQGWRRNLDANGELQARRQLPPRHAVFLERPDPDHDGVRRHPDRRSSARAVRVGEQRRWRDVGGRDRGPGDHGPGCGQLVRGRLLHQLDGRGHPGQDARVKVAIAPREAHRARSAMRRRCTETTKA
mmetsp:Transcript_4933/g.12994  ORF Transcript_4933/g.12994 Transcript_4933/m.12994 type:complete len:218 (+) Transcript_4933:458-1111(+)